MEAFIHQVQAVAGNPPALFGLLFVAALVNVFFPPVPIEAGTIFAGYLSGTGHGSLSVVLASTVSGMTIGSLILFALARRYGGRLLEGTVLKRLIREQSYRRAERWVGRYGVWTLFLGKCVPGMSLAAVVGCGALGLGARRAAVAIALSNLLFFAALSLGGRVLGKNWALVADWVKYLGVSSLLVVAALAIVLAAWLARRRRREASRPPSDR